MRSAASGLRTIRRTLPLAATALLAIGGGALAKPLTLAHDYYGTYTFDGATKSEMFHLEFEQQQGKHYDHVAMFATNLAEFVGDADLTKQNTRLVGELKDRGNGNHPPRVRIQASVGGGGDVLQGTFEIHRHLLPKQKGTFTIFR